MPGDRPHIAPPLIRKASSMMGPPNKFDKKETETEKNSKEATSEESTIMKPLDKLIQYYKSCL